MDERPLAQEPGEAYTHYMKRFLTNQGWTARLLIIGVTAAILFIGAIQFRWMFQGVEAEQDRQIRAFIVSISRALRNGVRDLTHDLYWQKDEQTLPEIQADLAQGLNSQNLPSGLITGVSILNKSGLISQFQIDSQTWIESGQASPQWKNFLRIFFNEHERVPHEAILFPREYRGLSETDKNGGLLALKIPGNELVAIYRVDIDILIRENILPTLEDIFDDHEITFSLTQNDREEWQDQLLIRDFSHDEKHRFSPWKAIFRRSSEEMPLYFHYRSDFLMNSDNNDFQRDMIMGYTRPPKSDEWEAQEWDGIMIKLTPKGLSIIHQMERKIALNWLLSETLLLGLGGAFFLLLYQRQRIKVQQLKEREFVAAITHELRTPLTVIQSAADNIKEGIVSEKRLPEYGNLITSQTLRLGEMIEGILLFSRMEGRKDVAGPDRKMTPEELKDPLTKRIPLGKEGVKIDFGGIPKEFFCDSEGLELILGNLLTNSLTHAYEKDGPIRVQGHIKLPKEIIFTVEDEGSGIPMKEQKKLFTPFYRGARSRENQIKGSGLGLYLASRRAVTMGGKLTVESPILGLDGKKHQGCRFTLTIPYKEKSNVN